MALQTDHPSRGRDSAMQIAGHFMMDVISISYNRCVRISIRDRETFCRAGGKSCREFQPRNFAFDP
jgi:hypothetical protein